MKRHTLSSQRRSAVNIPALRCINCTKMLDVEGECAVFILTARLPRRKLAISVAAAALLCGEHLFCGDTLFAGSIGRTDLEGGSSAQMADSLRKLAQLPIPRETQVLPGHGEFSTFGAELDNNYYIRSALRGGNDIF